MAWIWHQAAYVFALALTFLDRIREVVRCRIRSSAVVVDVGGGNRPFLRANIVVERYLHTDQERPGTGAIIRSRHRAYVVADARHLPFRNKSVDFIFCRNLAEHVEDIDTFLLEQERAAPQGLLMVPSELGEHFDNQFFHCWLINSIDGCLTFKSKTKLVENDMLQDFVTRVIRDRDAGILMLFALYYRKYLRVLHPWEGRITYRVVSRPDPELRVQHHAEQHKDTLCIPSRGERMTWLVYEALSWLIMRVTYRRKAR